MLSKADNAWLLFFKISQHVGKSHDFKAAVNIKLSAIGILTEWFRNAHIFHLEGLRKLFIYHQTRTTETGIVHFLIGWKNHTTDKWHTTGKQWQLVETFHRLPILSEKHTNFPRNNMNDILVASVCYLHEKITFTSKQVSSYYNFFKMFCIKVSKKGSVLLKQQLNQ